PGSRPLTASFAFAVVGARLLLFSGRRRHTRCLSDWSSDVCSSDLRVEAARRIVRLPQTKVDWLWEADDAARSLDPSVRQVVASYGDSLQRVLIASSDGRLVEEERPRIRFVVQVVAARDGVIQTGFEGPAGIAGVEFMDAHP